MRNEYPDLNRSSKQIRERLIIDNKGGTIILILKLIKKLGVKKNK